MNKREFKRWIRIDENGCWLWQRSTRGNGYGQCSYCDESSREAHRLAYRLWVGDPGEFLVCHKCDVPLCVNPKHLFLGTHKDNSQDMARKGRVNHPIDRPYNTAPARQALAARYNDPEFRAVQGRKISAALKRRNDNGKC